ncbi:Hypothetical predicted protein [Lecanosticta acicola]|uniref:Uncharacterized protein n=1 Tax=Lecanosticta acicola TaxID=111012 RepID=A0AAI8YUL7_9PEZI|nr:Hypothetical predicted protein [Lecanosticta acicola]
MSEHLSKSLYKQHAYASNIQAQTQDSINLGIARFQEQIKQCLHKRTQAIEQGVQSLELGVQSSGEKLDRMNSRTREENKILLQRLSVMESAMEERDARRAAREAAWELSKQQTLDVFCREIVKVSAWVNRDPPNPAPVQYHVTLQPSAPCFPVRSGDLMNVLGVVSDAEGNYIDTKDVSYTFALGRMLTSSRQSRAAAILRDEDFQRWLQGPQSHVVVLNGMDRASIDTCSAVTYSIALLRQTLDQMEVAVPTSFLCGLHTMPHDPFYGTIGMLRSLCSQLVLAFPEGLVLTSADEQLLYQVASGDVVAVCELFRLLLISIAQKSPGCVIFCMIDDIYHLEQSEEKSSFEQAIYCLQSLVNELVSGGNPVVLKLLLASRTMSILARHWVDESSCITIQERPFGHGHGYGETQMQMQAFEAAAR